MTSRIPLAAAAVLTTLAGAGAAPAAASAAATLAVDRPCYAQGEVIDVSGAGFTPGGTVSLSFTGAGVGLNELQTDLAGRVRAGFEVRERDLEVFLGPDEVQGEVLLAAVDQPPGTDPAAPPAADPAAPPAAASTSFLLTRFGAAWNQDADAFRPRRRLDVEVAGFTGAAGRTVYLHYVRGGRRVATVSLGRLRGPCGTLRRTLPRAFPARALRALQAGRWRLAFTLSRTDPRAVPGFSWDVTVRRRDAR